MNLEFIILQHQKLLKPNQKIEQTIQQTIRPKIFNHKEFIKTLDTKDILDNMNSLPCNCTTSPFTNPNHGHIVTGDICIVQTNKFKKQLCKGSKYREAVSINFSNCKSEIKNSLTKFSSDLCNKKGIPVKCSTQQIRKEKSMKALKNLKNNFKFNKVKQVLKVLKVISYLNILKEQYVICAIGNGANNIEFIRNIMSKYS